MYAYGCITIGRLTFPTYGDIGVFLSPHASRASFMGEIYFLLLGRQKRRSKFRLNLLFLSVFKWPFYFIFFNLFIFNWRIIAL